MRLPPTKPIGIDLSTTGLLPGGNKPLVNIQRAPLVSFNRAPTISLLYAIAVNNGKPVWKRRNSDRGARLRAPIVANGVVFLGNRAYDARNGNLVWSNPSLDDGVSPIVVNGRLYANTTDGQVSAWGLK